MNVGYYVTTLDPETGHYTPQIGIPEGPYSFRGLFAVVRELRRFGYSARYSSRHPDEGDPYVRLRAEQLPAVTRLLDSVPNEAQSAADLETSARYIGDGHFGRRQ